MSRTENTERTIDMIRAHAIHESQFTPESVHVRDKLFLLAEIDRLREEVAALKIELDGAAHNRFYDQRDAYFEGVGDAR